MTSGVSCSLQEERWTSKSYPGLLSVSTHHLVPVNIPGLPKDERFVTQEPRLGGVLENHWRWVGKEEELAGALLFLQ